MFGGDSVFFIPIGFIIGILIFVLAGFYGAAKWLASNFLLVLLAVIAALVLLGFGFALILIGMEAYPKRTIACMVGVCLLIFVVCSCITSEPQNTPAPSVTIDTTQAPSDDLSKYILTYQLDDPYPTAGDNIRITLTVAKDGTAITDLEAEGLRLWWWTDIWEDGHENGLLDAVYSNHEDNSGLSLTADVLLPSAGTYYICTELKDLNDTLYIREFIPIQVSERYTLTVEPSNAVVSIGDILTLSATVYKEGVPVTDLSAEGLRLWWWTDIWSEGHDDGLLDAAYSNNDNNSGQTLSTDLSFSSIGSYYICAELKDTDDFLYQRVFIKVQTENPTD